MKRNVYTIKLTKRRRKRRVGRPKVITFKRLLGSGISRPYKYKNRLMLGSGNTKTKQTGGFFPLGAALTAAPIVIDILKELT